jgi:protoheme IX farnesyltransferase
VSEVATVPRLSHLLSLVKPRIVGLLCLTGVSALLAAGGTSPLETVAFVLAGALIAGASAALNCWYDRDIDQYMSRTAGRPLPRGALSPRAALLFAATLLAGGTIIGLAALPAISVASMWAGVLAYVGLYTVVLKRRSRLGVVLGGSAGSFPVLAGWTAVRPLEPVAVGVAALVFVWTPAHAWALADVYRDEFAAVGVATVPALTDRAGTMRAIGVAALLTGGLAVALLPWAGQLYGATVLTGLPCFGWAYLTYVQRGSKATAVRAFFSSNAFLAALVVGWAAGGLLRPSVTTNLLTATLVTGLFAWVWRARPALREVRSAPVCLRLDRTHLRRVLARLSRGTPTGGEHDE